MRVAVILDNSTERNGDMRTDDNQNPAVLSEAPEGQGTQQ